MTYNLKERVYGTTKVQFSSCAKVFRNFQIRWVILMLFWLSLGRTSGQRTRNLRQTPRCTPGQWKKLCSPDDNKNAGAKTGQKHKNDRALCRVKYGENIQWCSQDGCIQDRVTIFIGPYFFPSLQLNYYEHRHGLILDSSCDYVSARVVSFKLEKGANQVLSPANWIRTWFTDLTFDGLRRTKTQCARSDYDLCWIISELWCELTDIRGSSKPPLLVRKTTE